MRGIHSVVDDLRRQVFTEVARLAYEGGDFSRIDALPYKIIPGEDAQYRHDVFLERAIVTERLRLACGLPLRTAYNKDKVYAEMLHDKKAQGGQITVIKVPGLGCWRAETIPVEGLRTLLGMED